MVVEQNGSFSRMTDCLKACPDCDRMQCQVFHSSGGAACCSLLSLRWPVHSATPSLTTAQEGDRESLTLLLAISTRLNNPSTRHPPPSSFPCYLSLFSHTDGCRKGLYLFYFTCWLRLSFLLSKRSRHTFIRTPIFDSWDVTLKSSASPLTR